MMMMHCNGKHRYTSGYGHYSDVVVWLHAVYCPCICCQSRLATTCIDLLDGIDWIYYWALRSAVYSATFFLHILPETWNSTANSTTNGLWTIAGLLFCFIVEKCCASTEESQHRVCAIMNLLANFVDNFTHGLAVGGSFLVNTRFGLLTTFAILIHEIPHEISDFAILYVLTIIDGRPRRLSCWRQSAVYSVRLSRYSVVTVVMIYHRLVGFCHLRPVVFSTLHWHRSCPICCANRIRDKVWNNWYLYLPVLL